MNRLAVVIREAPQEFEADLRATFGVRLADYYSAAEPHAPVRELLVYMRALLSEDSRTSRALGEPRRIQWTVTHEVLDGIYYAWTKKHHPLRPEVDPDEIIAGDPEVQEALRLAHEEEAARQAALAADNST